MPRFCPSMMCVDFSKLEQEIRALEKAGVDMFHIDIMDGHFVPNFALGPEDIKAIRTLTTLTYDVHLMVSNPDQYIQRFADLGCEILYIHAEAPKHLHRTLSTIQSLGIKSGLAINPGTPLSSIEDVLEVTDVVMVMSVNPGFAGQPFIPGTYRRIERLAVMIEEQGLNTKIAIDGAISPEVVQKLGSRVEYFVLGTAGLFRKDSTYTQAMQTLRALCEQGQEVVAA